MGAFPFLSHLNSAKLYQVRSSPLLIDEVQSYHSPLRSVSRLKRVHSYSPKCETPLPEACVYSTYMILFARYLASEYSVPIIKHNPPSLSQILSRLHISRPLSISSASGISSQDVVPIISVSDDNMHSEKIKIPKTNSFLGDIELVSINVLSHSLSQGEVEEKEIIEDSSISGESSYPTLASGSSKSKGFLNYHDNLTEEVALIAQAAMEVILLNVTNDMSRYSSIYLAIWRTSNYISMRKYIGTFTPRDILHVSQINS